MRGDGICGQPDITRDEECEQSFVARACSFGLRHTREDEAKKNVIVWYRLRG